MEFEAFPKIPRLKRDMVITEKIDGTNACVLIEDCTDHDSSGPGRQLFVYGWLCRCTRIQRSRGRGGMPHSIPQSLQSHL
jgi:hypothetical protein